MPLFDYVCFCGAKVFDHIVRDDAMAEAPTCKACTRRMQPNLVYMVRTVGPIWANTEQYERALLTPQERAHPDKGGLGLRITGPSDVAVLEARMLREHGLRPMDPASAEYRESLERDEDELADKRKIAATEQAHGGAEAAVKAVSDYELKVEVQEQTGWTAAEYARWSNTHDEAERALERGSLPVPDPGTGDDAGQPDDGGASVALDV